MYLYYSLLLHFLIETCMLLFRNGLLTEHNLVEVNGQNVVGLKVGKVCLLKMLSSAKSEGTRVVALRLQ